MNRLLGLIVLGVLIFVFVVAKNTPNDPRPPTGESQDVKEPYDSPRRVALRRAGQAIYLYKEHCKHRPYLNPTFSTAADIAAITYLQESLQLQAGAAGSGKARGELDETRVQMGNEAFCIFVEKNVLTKPNRSDFTMPQGSN
jgi:hypothetical protein